MAAPCHGDHIGQVNSFLYAVRPHHWDDMLLASALIFSDGYPAPYRATATGAGLGRVMNPRERRGRRRHAAQRRVVRGEHVWGEGARLRTARREIILLVRGDYVFALTGSGDPVAGGAHVDQRG